MSAGEVEGGGGGRRGLAGTGGGEEETHGRRRTGRERNERLGRSEKEGRLTQVNASVDATSA